MFCINSPIVIHVEYCLDIKLEALPQFFVATADDVV